MANDSTKQPLDLEAIAKRASDAREHWGHSDRLSAADVPALVAEVRHLRALLAPVQEAARTIRDADPWESQAAGQHARGDREATLRKAALATIAGEDAP